MVLALLPALPSAAEGTGIPGAPVRPYVSERAPDYVIVKWTDPALDADLVTGYEIRYSSDAGANWTSLDHADLITLSHKLEGLKTGVTYAVEIRSIGVDGNSAWAPAVSRSAVIQMDSSDLNSYSCVTVIDGRVKCWNNGWPSVDGRRIASESPGYVSVTQVTAAEMTWSDKHGFPHHCVLSLDHTVKCGGYNKYGQLGDGTTTTRYELVKVLGISTAIQVSAGSGRTCALLDGGTVQCWGMGLLTGLGGSTTTSNPTPTTINGISGAVQISAGSYHACALIANGTVQCWGDNFNGQLGDGTTTDKNVLTQIN
jgi:hypothetical protein